MPPVQAQALFNQEQAARRTLHGDLSYRTQKLVPPAPRGRLQSRGAARPTPASSSPPCRLGTIPLNPYEQIYCARGEIRKTASRNSNSTVCRSHLHPHLPGQSAPAADDLFCLCAGGGLAPQGAAIHLPGSGYCRFHPTQTAQDRGPGHHLGPPHQGRHGFRLSLPEGVPPGLGSPASLRCPDPTVTPLLEDTAPGPVGRGVAAGKMLSEGPR